MCVIFSHWKLDWFSSPSNTAPNKLKPIVKQIKPWCSNGEGSLCSCELKEWPGYLSDVSVLLLPWLFCFYCKCLNDLSSISNFHLCWVHPFARVEHLQGGHFWAGSQHLWVRVSRDSFSSIYKTKERDVVNLQGTVFQDLVLIMMMMIQSLPMFLRKIKPLECFSSFNKSILLFYFIFLNNVYWGKVVPWVARSSENLWCCPPHGSWGPKSSGQPWWPAEPFTHWATCWPKTSILAVL